MWTYGEDVAAAVATEAVLEFPPAEELAPLRSAAQRGHIVLVRAEIERLAGLDPRYGPLAAELRGLARGFDLARICQRLEARS